MLNASQKDRINAGWVNQVLSFFSLHQFNLLVCRRIINKKLMNKRPTFNKWGWATVRKLFSSFHPFSLTVFVSMKKKIKRNESEGDLNMCWILSWMDFVCSALITKAKNILLFSLRFIPVKRKKKKTQQKMFAWHYCVVFILLSR